MRQLQIIGFALVAGAVCFAVIAAALPFLNGSEPIVEGGAPAAAAASIIGMLSLVHAALFASLLPAALILPQRVAGRNQAGLQQSMIVRWAMLEGAALFGSVVVLLGGLEGRLPAEPIFYANLASTAAFVMLVVTDVLRMGLPVRTDREKSLGPR